MQMDERTAARRAERIETLLQQIAAGPDPAVRAQTEELVQTLLDLYGEGLARLLELSFTSERGGEELVAAFAADELVGSLLLLHGLHPEPIEDRVAAALEQVRPYLQSHGGNVTLLDVTNGVAHLRLQGSCHGCPSSTITLKLAIEDAIYAAAPDLEGLEVEGVVEAPRPLITLTPTRRGNGKAAAAPTATSAEDGVAARPTSSGAWLDAEGLPRLAEGRLYPAIIEGQALIFCRVAASAYAYRDRCPGCGAALGSGTLSGTTLTCAGCERGYDVYHAGRSLDGPALFLDPVPLLVDGDRLKVALPVAAEAS